MAPQLIRQNSTLFGKRQGVRCTALQGRRALHHYLPGCGETIETASVACDASSKSTRENMCLKNPERETAGRGPSDDALGECFGNCFGRSPIKTS